MRTASVFILILFFAGTPFGLTHERFDCRMSGQRGLTRCCCIAAPQDPGPVSEKTGGCCSSKKAADACGSGGDCGGLASASAGTAGCCCDVTLTVAPPMVHPTGCGPAGAAPHADAVVAIMAPRRDTPAAAQPKSSGRRPTCARHGPRLHLQIRVLLI